ncbi:hypothetical protein NGRA_1907 [Nosema granulosis]|uniref:Uncharacterized protein n=1 Tax=Nosema granulosis TaxID=83296 RepID=A0A9P6KYX8_9MICR|nr:hypothetical protein NGRA_1907 [Nosema granulosis]
MLFVVFHCLSVLMSQDKYVQNDSSQCEGGIQGKVICTPGENCVIRIGFTDKPEHASIIIPNECSKHILNEMRTFVEEETGTKTAEKSYSSENVSTSKDCSENVNFELYCTMRCLKISKPSDDTTANLEIPSAINTQDHTSHLSRTNSADETSKSNDEIKTVVENVSKEESKETFSLPYNNDIKEDFLSFDDYYFWAEGLEETEDPDFTS